MPSSSTSSAETMRKWRIKIKEEGGDRYDSYLSKQRKRMQHVYKANKLKREMNPELSAKYRTAERQYRNKNKKSTETATEASVVQSSSRHAAGRKVRRATLRSKNR